MKVKITQCSFPAGWYTDLIGEEFEVGFYGGEYVVKEDLENRDGPWRHIKIDDCETIEQ